MPHLGEPWVIFKEHFVFQNWFGLQLTGRSFASQNLQPMNNIRHYTHIHVLTSNVHVLVAVNCIAFGWGRA